MNGDNKKYLANQKAFDYINQLNLFKILDKLGITEKSFDVIQAIDKTRASLSKTSTANRLFINRAVVLDKVAF